ncbi:MAG: hypothetical protein HRU69_03970 [Flammeovirgaceae bacterium]|jgi:hypothetical protein|nr:MAG: hypothetical protein HRU69_03970 [Flammeovirgaceae bacterium]
MIGIRSLLIFLSFVAFATLESFAQRQEREFQFGLLSEYAANVNTLVSAIIADRYYIFDPEENLDGFRIGTFARLIQGKGFVVTELSYFQCWSVEAYLDLKPDTLTAFPGWPGRLQHQHRMFKLNAGYGTRIFRNITLDAGLVGSYQLKEKSFGEDPSGYPSQPPRPENVNQILSDAFSRFVLSGYVRASYVFGPMHIYFYYEQGLTSIFNDVYYNGTHFPMNTRMQSWSLGVSYVIFKTSK